VGFDAHEQEQSRLLRIALTQAGISTGELWLKYFSLGGSVGEYEVEAYLQGLLSLPTLQRNLLACAANELIDEVPPLPRAPYSEDLQDPPDVSETADDRRGQSEPDSGSE
jgi:hypothetical protein